ncbi:MAG: hypothetical protein ACHQTE_01645, partial [Candidatus Saccharimonadales bacterium]
MSLFSKKQPDLPRRRQPGLEGARTPDPTFEERYTFRRNRTITGSASSQVVGIGEAHAHLKSDRVRAHDLVRQRRHIGLILGLVMIAAALLYGLVSQFTAHTVVHLAGQTQALDSSYNKAIEAYLADQPIERFRFLLNEQHLNAYIQSVTPEVASISSDGSAGLGVTSFTATMRHPIAGWSINGSQQYVDASGVSFSRNYFATPAVQIIDNSGVQVAAGQAIASNQFLSFVGRVVGLTAASHYTVTQVIIPVDTT